MKFKILIFGVLFVCCFMYWSNSINFIKKDSSFEFFLDLNSLEKLNFDIKKNNFIDINFFEHTSENYDLLLSGDFDSTLFKALNNLQKYHYVSILSLKKKSINQLIYENKISINQYKAAFNYIYDKLKNYSKKNCIVVYEKTLVPSVFRLNENLLVNYNGKGLIYDVFALNLSNLDTDLSISKRSLEEILFQYEFKFNQTNKLALIDIPKFMYQNSFFSELSTSLSEVRFVFASNSFFSFYNIDSYYRKTLKRIFIIYSRVNFKLSTFFLDLYPIFGAYNFDGRYDFSIDVNQGDESLNIEIGDDYYTERSIENLNYDKLYLCGKETPRDDHRYLVFKTNNKIYLKDLYNFNTDILVSQKISSNKNLVIIPKNKLSRCLENEYNIQIEDYDGKNEFTLLRYMN